ncbi:MAG: protein translocase subunit SecF [Gemmatimonadales bacterium]
MRLFDKANYDVLGAWKSGSIAALAFILPGLLLLAVRGLNTSIEFTGGTLIELQVTDTSINTGSIRSALSGTSLSGAEIKVFDTPQDFVIRARLDPQAGVSEESTQATAAALDSAMASSFGTEMYKIVRTEAIGPKVGRELRSRAQLALLLAFGAIFVVIWFRYEWRFGLAAVLATVHDIFSTVAFVSYMNLEVSLVVVAGLLTIIGYSLNDTIVTFDRVRETLRKYKRHGLYDILNRSINETLPRTALTSGTTIVATIALLLLAGKVISGFAWVMTFGIVTGTFSSIFIASPLLMAIEHRWPGEDVRGTKKLSPATATN